MSRQKISKPLLQASLRPVLNSLSHYNKLKLHMLQGLARLLKLLHGWFNAALGRRPLFNLLSTTSDATKLCMLEVADSNCSVFLYLTICSTHAIRQHACNI